MLEWIAVTIVDPKREWLDKDYVPVFMLIDIESSSDEVLLILNSLPFHNLFSSY